MSESRLPFEPRKFLSSRNTLYGEQQEKEEECRHFLSHLETFQHASILVVEKIIFTIYDYNYPIKKKNDNRNQKTLPPSILIIEPKSISSSFVVVGAVRLSRCVNCRLLRVRNRIQIIK